MPQRHNVLSCGASLLQAAEAYFDTHPLDHDDDIEAEHGVHAFESYDDSNVNTTVVIV